MYVVTWVTAPLAPITTSVNLGKRSVAHAHRRTPSRTRKTCRSFRAPSEVVSECRHGVSADQHVAPSNPGITRSDCCREARGGRVPNDNAVAVSPPSAPGCVKAKLSKSRRGCLIPKSNTVRRALTATIGAVLPSDRVLAVDDDLKILGILTEFLRVKGYEVLAATNAKDAFKLIAASPSHVVLLGIGLSRVGGMTALRHIRTSCPEIPVIIVTGDVDLDFAREALKLGAFRDIAKPFDYVHLADAIEAAVVSRG